MSQGNGNGQEDDQLVISPEEENERFAGDEEVDDWVFVAPTADDAGVIAKMGPVGLDTRYFDEGIKPGKTRRKKFIILCPETEEGAAEAKEIAYAYREGKACSVKLWPIGGLGTDHETLREWCRAR